MKYDLDRLMLEHGYVRKEDEDLIKKWITLDPTSKIGRGTKFGSYLVIEEFCEIGSGGYIGNGVVMRPRVKVGNRTMIGHNTVLEEGVKIGSDCRVQPLCYITKGVVIEDKVFIGPMVCTSNDKKMVHMRHDILGCELCGCVIKHGARVGCGSVILPGVTIGENALVGAGSVVTKNVGQGEIIRGDPAKIIGQVPEEEWI